MFPINDLIQPYFHEWLAKYHNNNTEMQMAYKHLGINILGAGFSVMHELVQINQVRRDLLFS